LSGRDLLSVALERADALEPRFVADEVMQWPEGAERELLEAGIIRRDDTATTVVCDACGEGHVEDVEIIVSPPRSSPRAYIHCPVVGRVMVPAERLLQWIIDTRDLAIAVSRALGLTGVKEEIVPGRLWTLGIAQLGGRPREVFLARGLSWGDGADIVGKCGRVTSGQPAVFVASSEPPQNIWNGDPPIIVSLGIVARLVQGCLVLDLDLLEGYFARPMIGLSDRYPKDKRIFQNQGKTWLVVYDGIPKSVGHSGGMTYICELLKNPGQEIYAASLGVARASDGNPEILGSAGEVLDQQALQEYNSRIQDIDEELAEAERNFDRGQIDSLNKERALIYAEVSRAMGLRGRKRKAVDDRERARQRVSQSIHRSLDAIKAQHEPLWHHLHNSMKIGMFLSYQPEKPTSWVT
jgi:hypothetical protein